MEGLLSDLNSATSPEDALSGFCTLLLLDDEHHLNLKRLSPMLKRLLAFVEADKDPSNMCTFVVRGLATLMQGQFFMAMSIDQPSRDVLQTAMKCIKRFLSSTANGGWKKLQRTAECAEEVARLFKWVVHGTAVTPALRDIFLDTMGSDLLALMEVVANATSIPPRVASSIVDSVALGVRFLVLSAEDFSLGLAPEQFGRKRSRSNSRNTPKPGSPIQSSTIAELPKIVAQSLTILRALLERPTSSSSTADEELLVSTISVLHCFLLQPQLLSKEHIDALLNTLLMGVGTPAELAAADQVSNRSLCCLCTILSGLRAGLSFSKEVLFPLFLQLGLNLQNRSGPASATGSSFVFPDPFRLASQQQKESPLRKKNKFGGRWELPELSDCILDFFLNSYFTGVTPAGPLCFGKHLWSWQQDEDRFAPYSELESSILSQVYFRDRKRSCALENYEVQFDTMMQVGRRGRSVSVQPVPVAYYFGSEDAFRAATLNSDSLVLPSSTDSQKLLNLAVALREKSQLPPSVYLQGLLLTLAVRSLQQDSKVDELPFISEYGLLVRELLEKTTHLTDVAKALVTVLEAKGNGWDVALGDYGLHEILTRRGVTPKNPVEPPSKAPKGERRTKLDSRFLITPEQQLLSLLTADSTVKSLGPHKTGHGSSSSVQLHSKMEMTKLFIHSTVGEISQWLLSVNQKTQKQFCEWFDDDCEVRQKVLQVAQLLLRDNVLIRIKAAVSDATPGPTKAPTGGASRKRGRESESSHSTLSSSLPMVTYSIGVCKESSAGPMKCPAGHKLVAHHSVQWRCDLCGGHEESASLACRACDYDVCSTCYNIQDKRIFDVSGIATIGQLLHTVFGGIRHDARPDAFHILGRLFGDPTATAESLQAQQLVVLPISEQLSVDGTALSSTTTIFQAVRLASHVAPLSKEAEHVRNLRPFPDAKPKPVMFHCFQDLHAGKCKCGGVSRRFASHSGSHSGQGKSEDPALAQLSFAASLLDQERARGGEAKEMASLGKEVEDLLQQFAMAHAKQIACFQSEALSEASALLAFLRHYPTLFRLPFRAELAKFINVGCFKYLLDCLSNMSAIAGGKVRVDLRASPDKVPSIVSRGDGVIADAVIMFRRLPPVRTRLDIQFRDEAGTGEGPNQEFYAELSAALLRKTSLWRLSDEGNMQAQPFPGSESHTDEFYALGAAFSRSFIDGFLMDLPLHPALWRWIRNPAMSNLEREALLAEIDPTLGETLAEFRKMSGDSIAALSLELDDGTAVVDEPSLNRYIDESVTSSLDHVKKNAEAFASGFMTFLPLTILHFFDISELNRVFCGERDESAPRFTAEELQAVVVGAHGYTTDCKEVQLFIQVLCELTVKEQTYFIEWLTGSPQLPPGGITRLGRPIQVVRKAMDHPGTLPSCNTCFLYVKLPPYDTRDKMLHLVRLAITEGRKNFALS